MGETGPWPLPSWAASARLLSWLLPHLKHRDVVVFLTALSWEAGGSVWSQLRVCGGHEVVRHPEGCGQRRVPGLLSGTPSPPSTCSHTCSPRSYPL